MNNDNVGFVVKTFSWLRETEEIVGSRKKTFLREYLKNFNLTDDEKKEVKALWEKKRNSKKIKKPMQFVIY